MRLKILLDIPHVDLTVVYRLTSPKGQPKSAGVCGPIVASPARTNQFIHCER